MTSLLRRASRLNKHGKELVLEVLVDELRFDTKQEVMRTLSFVLCRGNKVVSGRNKRVSHLHSDWQGEKFTMAITLYQTGSGAFQEKIYKLEIVQASTGPTKGPLTVASFHLDVSLYCSPEGLAQDAPFTPVAVSTSQLQGIEGTATVKLRCRCRPPNGPLEQGLDHAASEKHLSISQQSSSDSSASESTKPRHAKAPPPITVFSSSTSVGPTDSLTYSDDPGDEVMEEVKSHSEMSESPMRLLGSNRHRPSPSQDGRPPLAGLTGAVPSRRARAPPPAPLDLGPEQGPEEDLNLPRGPSDWTSPPAVDNTPTPQGRQEGAGPLEHSRDGSDAHGHADRESQLEAQLLYFAAENKRLQAELQDCRDSAAQQTELSDFMAVKIDRLEQELLDLTPQQKPALPSREAQVMAEVQEAMRLLEFTKQRVASLEGCLVKWKEGLPDSAYTELWAALQLTLPVRA